MIPKRDFGITRLEALFTPEILDLQMDVSLVESYREQRRRFILKRLELQTQIMLIVGVTLTAFFIWNNQQPNGKIYALKIGLLIEFFIFIC